MQLLKALWALAGAALCCFLVLVIHAQFLKEGQLAAGTCEIVTLDRDSSQPRRTIARQTARCACRKGQIAGTTRARPACVDARIIKTKQWCDMLPCLEGEGCDLLINRSGWTCTQPGGRIKTTTMAEYRGLWDALIFVFLVARSLKFLRCDGSTYCPGTADSYMQLRGEKTVGKTDG
ncbi:protein FAM19A5 isoform X2 [Microtus ochrogaster]|uniref:Protein FAM19A5 isoform X2 n=1 Tax=Microtus ochrogaster TaxID=79684 RepID=A0ABM1U895_MICOH|nr:protein FAM19A5 isoform X2 [Microtus ochrogaster]